MKLLTINTHSERGGAAKVASTIHKFLVRRPITEKVSAEMVVGWGDNDPLNHLSSLYASQFSKYINAAWFRLQGSEGGLLLRMAGKKLVKKIEDADIVHIHNLHGYYLFPGILELLRDKPVIWTLHDFWIATGRCAFPIDCTGPQNQCADCHGRSKYPAALRSDFRKHYLKKMTLLSKLRKLTVTVPSHAFNRELANYGLGMNDVRVVYNGVDTAIFRPANDRERDSILADLNVPRSDRPLLSFAANQVADARKGLRYLAQAMDMLEYPTTLVIIGDNKGARQLFPGNSRHNLIFTGLLRDKMQVAKWIKISDYFINPSVSETFGMTNLESLSCGTRPIVFSLPVFRETLSEWGLFVDKLEGRALSEKIRECIENKTIGEMRSAAHTYVCDKFSEDIMCNNFLDLYKERLK